METEYLSSRRGCRRGAAVLETLEPRLLMDAVYPTAHEQFMLELINRGRSDPQAEVDRYPATYWTGAPDLNEGIDPPEITAEPKQPLAFNAFLTDAAQGHSQWMLDADKFQHAGVGDSDPGDRMADAGYVFDPPSAYGENLALRYSSAPLDLTDSVEALARGLFVDKDYPHRGHRINLMAPDLREIGVGVRAGMFTLSGTDYHAVAVTEDFAFTGTGVFLTGVIYDDADGDAFYTPGEGHGAVTVKATRAADNATFTTTTWDAGGYTLSVPAGTYDVTAYGGPLRTTHRETGVVIGGENEKVDFVASAGLFGDFTGDGSVDEADIDALLAAIHSGSPTSSFDLTGDSPAVVDRTDVDVLVRDLVFINDSAANRGTAYGDANLDGAVDDNDLSLLLANWAAGTTWATGNFIDTVGGGATVNDDDLSLLLANWTGPLDLAADSTALADQPTTSPPELTGPARAGKAPAASIDMSLLAAAVEPSPDTPAGMVDLLASCNEPTRRTRRHRGAGPSRHAQPDWWTRDALARASLAKLRPAL